VKWSHIAFAKRQKTFYLSLSLSLSLSFTHLQRINSERECRAISPWRHRRVSLRAFDFRNPRDGSYARAPNRGVKACAWPVTRIFALWRMCVACALQKLRAEILSRRRITGDVIEHPLISRCSSAIGRSGLPRGSPHGTQVVAAAGREDFSNEATNRPLLWSCRRAAHPAWVAPPRPFTCCCRYCWRAAGTGSGVAAEHRGSMRVSIDRPSGVLYKGHRWWSKEQDGSREAVVATLRRRERLAYRGVSRERKRNPIRYVPARSIRYDRKLNRVDDERDRVVRISIVEMSGLSTFW